MPGTLTGAMPSGPNLVHLATAYHLVRPSLNAGWEGLIRPKHDSGDAAKGPVSAGDRAWQSPRQQIVIMGVGTTEKTPAKTPPLTQARKPVRPLPHALIFEPPSGRRV